MSPPNREADTSSSVSTLNDLVFRVRKISSARPDFLTIRRNGRRETLSATDFLRSVHSLAIALEERGLRSGERVVIFSENRPEWHIVDFACHLIGAPTVPIFPGLSPGRVAYVLRNSGARWVFFSDRSKRDLLSTLKGALTQIPEMVAFDGDAPVAGGSTVTRMMGEGAGRLGEVPLERFRDRAQPDDLASILYTGGMSGDSKGVMLSHQNFVSNMLSCSRLFQLGSEDRAVSLLPLSHVFQRTVDHLCFYQGVRIHYAPYSEGAPQELGDDERSTVLVAAPEHFERFRESEFERVDSFPRWRRSLFDWALGAGKRHAVASREGFIGPILAFQRWLAIRGPLKASRERFGGDLRFAISGGSLLTGEAADYFDAIGIPLYQGYGLTETSPVLAANSPHSQRIGSVGKPLSEVELRIDDQGEILVRGPGVAQGYWENPDATAASTNESGWFRTGDLGRLDKSGYVFVTDRKRDLLTLSNGEPISPRSIEAKLVGSPIAQAVVIGDGRPFPAVLIALDSELPIRERSAPEQEALERKINERIARVNLELPKEIRLQKWKLLDRPLTIEDGELTPTGDLRRRQIQHSFAEEIGHLYRTES